MLHTCLSYITSVLLHHQCTPTSPVYPYITSVPITSVLPLQCHLCSGPSHFPEGLVRNDNDISLTFPHLVGVFLPSQQLAPHASSWLPVVTSPGMGLYLDSNEYQMAIGGGLSCILPISLCAHSTPILLSTLLVTKRGMDHR